MFTSGLNPCRTEKKSSLQDCSGFSEPLSHARIFVAFALYENTFLDLQLSDQMIGPHWSEKFEQEILVASKRRSVLYGLSFNFQFLVLSLTWPLIWVIFVIYFIVKGPKKIHFSRTAYYNLYLTRLSSLFYHTRQMTIRLKIKI